MIINVLTDVSCQEQCTTYCQSLPLCTDFLFFAPPAPNCSLHLFHKQSEEPVLSSLLSNDLCKRFGFTIHFLAFAWKMCQGLRKVLLSPRDLGSVQLLSV